MVNIEIKENESVKEWEVFLNHKLVFVIKRYFERDKFLAPRFGVYTQEEAVKLNGKRRSVCSSLNGAIKSIMDQFRIEIRKSGIETDWLSKPKEGTKENVLNSQNK